ncbi:hypothetical protein D3C73_1554070 [compost metagenome]
MTGKTNVVCRKCGDEYARAVELLSQRNPRFKERAEKGELEQTTILKFVADKLKYLDFSRGVGPAAVTETAV